jgi:hypothetical protein
MSYVVSSYLKEFPNDDINNYLKCFLCDIHVIRRRPFQDYRYLSDMFWGCDCHIKYGDMICSKCKNKVCECDIRYFKYHLLDLRFDIIDTPLDV